MSRPNPFWGRKKDASTGPRSYAIVSYEYGRRDRSPDRHGKRPSQQEAIDWAKVLLRRYEALPSEMRPEFVVLANYSAYPRPLQAWQEVWSSRRGNPRRSRRRNPASSVLKVQDVLNRKTVLERGVGAQADQAFDHQVSRFERGGGSGNQYRITLERDGQVVKSWGARANRGNRSSRAVRKRLRKAGCVEKRQRGSHLSVSCPPGKTGIVPVHGSRDIPIGTLRSIERQTGVRLRNPGVPKLVAKHPAYAYSCPNCGAEAGYRCRTQARSGAYRKLLKHPHKERKEEAKKARQTNPRDNPKRKLSVKKTTVNQIRQAAKNFKPAFYNLDNSDVAILRQAADYLNENGWSAMQRNYRSRFKYMSAPGLTPARASKIAAAARYYTRKSKVKKRYNSYRRRN